jgi:hypothetical protein
VDFPGLVRPDSTFAASLVLAARHRQRISFLGDELAQDFIKFTHPGWSPLPVTRERSPFKRRGLACFFSYDYSTPLREPRSPAAWQAFYPSAAPRKSEIEWDARWVSDSPHIPVFVGRVRAFDCGEKAGNAKALRRYLDAEISPRLY